MADFEFIDAHHHLWDLRACSYPWLEARGVERFFGDPSPIQKNYLLTDFLSESSIFRPSKSVHIQVGVAPGAELVETRWIHELGEKPEALVCFADLVATDREQTLDAQSRFARVRGVRQILGRHRKEDAKHGSDALIDNPLFLEGLRSLATRRLSFDLQLIPEQHLRVAQLLQRVEGLQVALCHAGSPWDQSESGLRSWRSGLKALAAREETVVKLSGLGMFRRDWKQQDIERVALPVIDTFGPARVMLGSNFPVDKLYHSYEDWWQAMARVMERFNAEERSLMLTKCAQDFYRI